MQLGIIGLPQSGKTTIFNALTHGDVPTDISGSKIEMHTAVIDVPDERVTKLTEMYDPKKVVHAKVSYVDIAGLEGKKTQGGISGPLLNVLSQMDGSETVLRSTVFFDGKRRYEFYAALPPLSEDEYQALIGSFTPVPAGSKDGG